MNKLFTFCKSTAATIHLVLHFAYSAWTFQVLINTEPHKVDRLTRRFEKRVNTACFILSPLITVSALFFSLTAIAAIIVAGIAGCVVELATCCQVKPLEDIEDKDTPQPVPNSYACVADVLIKTAPVTLPPVVCVEVPFDSYDAPSTASDTDKIDESYTHSTDEEGEPSLCSLGMM